MPRTGDSDAAQRAALPDWVSAGARYVAEWISYQVRASQVPGCAVAIEYSGVAALDIALGTSDSAQGTPLSPNHLFRMASHSKTFAAVAILLLCERGALSLDDPIGLFLDGLHAQIASSTVRHLLSHQVGIKRDGPGYGSLRQPFPDALGLRALCNEEPIELPSAGGKYSNLGFGLLGPMLESITRERYAVWLQREVIDAAGLKHTFANAAAISPERLAQGHSEPILLGHRQTWPSDQQIDALDPAFGLVSTPADLCRFYAQLDPDAEASLLTRTSRLEMMYDQWEDPVGPEPRSYGLGVTKGLSAGSQWFGHIGGFVGMMSRTIVVPRDRLAISVVVNAQDGRAPAWTDGALRIMKWFKTEYVASVHSVDWQGRWWNAWGVLDLVATGERVMLANPAQHDPFAFAPRVQAIAADRGVIGQCSAFQHPGEVMSLVRGPDGGVVGLDVAGELWLPENIYAAELVELAGR
jgi:D-alanyl-D-alanine carboxypeptidase